MNVAEKVGSAAELPMPEAVTPGGGQTQSSPNLPREARQRRPGQTRKSSAAKPDVADLVDSPRGRGSAKAVESTNRTRPDARPRYRLEVIAREKLKLPEADDRSKPDQPGEEEFDGLVENIRQLGILEPIVVREDRTPGSFTIIAGKRRFKAAMEVGLAMIPCHVVESPDDGGRDVLIVLSENAQRKANSPYEQALLFERAREQVGLTKKEVADKYGVAKSLVTEYLQLLDPRLEKKLGAKKFEDLKAGRYSAKAAIRGLVELKERQNAQSSRDGHGSSNDPTMAYCDVNAGITFKVAWRKGSPPDKSRLISALKRWIEAIETA